VTFFNGNISEIQPQIYSNLCSLIDLISFRSGSTDRQINCLLFLSVAQRTIMFSIESGANNSFIQSHRSAVSVNSVYKVSSDLNHKTDAHLCEANNFLEVTTIYIQ